MMEQANLEKGTIERDSDEAKAREFRGVAKGVDVANRTIEVIASTIKIDRDGEIILPSAFTETLPKFLASNSPLLATHMHRSWVATPTQIGWITDGKIERARVRMWARFATTELAEEYWKLASDPSGKGVAASIGFIPLQWIQGTVADLVREFPEIRQAVREAGWKDEDRLRVYTKIELLELSIVPVPSNREAMQVLAAKLFGEGDGKGDDESGKAMSAFTAAVAAEVVKLLAADSRSAILDPRSEESAIRNLQSAITKLDESFVESRAILADKMAEISELITLSPETLAIGARTGAPPADERRSRAGDGDDGAEAAQSATADQARSLLAKCSNQ